jgi:dATP pyrophosphohydrolase
VIPYRSMPTGLEFALLKTSDGGYWQFVAGGGEEGETPLQAAIREVIEEIGIADQPLLPLDSMCTIPTIHFKAATGWPSTLYVIPEYAFAVDTGDRPIRLSHEHTEIWWVDYARAYQSLKWDSNRTALWELHQRLSP